MAILIKRSANKGSSGEHLGEQFAQKPNLETAKAYLVSGNYFWNSGMFVPRASTWLTASDEFRPDILDATQKAWKQKTEDEADDTLFVRPTAALFKSIPSELMDYAVIERCPGSQYQVKIVEIDAGLSDLGAWGAVWQVGNKYLQGNVTSGNVLLSKSSNSLAHASNRSTHSAPVLVVDRKNSQDVKNIVSQLE